ncbi:MAG: hypothetical protein KDB22_23780 [Planctomycetales bacterium]|nr:hypothetical protein [Planctomycetales bacterium]
MRTRRNKLLVTPTALLGLMLGSYWFVRVLTADDTHLTQQSITLGLPTQIEETEFEAAWRISGEKVNLLAMPGPGNAMAWAAWNEDGDATSALTSTGQAANQSFPQFDLGELAVPDFDASGNAIYGPKQTSSPSGGQQGVGPKTSSAFPPSNQSTSLTELSPPPAKAPGAVQVGELPSPQQQPSRGSTFDPLDALPPSMLGELALPPSDSSRNQPGFSVPNSALPDSSSAKGLAPQKSTAGPAASPGQSGPTPQSPPTTTGDNSEKKYDGPMFFEPYGDVKGPPIDVLAQQVPYDESAFLPTLRGGTTTDAELEKAIYRGKFSVPVQRPLLELGRPLYTSGIYPPGKDWFGRYNLVMPHFMVYGDFRTGVGVNRNAAGDAHNIATRLNLDMDLEITATERIHAFISPLDRAGDYTRLDFTNRFEFVDRTDLRLDTLFFEGDLGAILAGGNDTDATFDLPFSFGFLPLFYQNGIWAADNVIGAAVALPAKHSRLLNWSNYDATFFWASDQINSDAFPGDNNAAEFFGTAWFIEAYDGYIETDYAFVHDDSGQHRSYHNFSFAFSRRYLHRVSNTVRIITNFNQSLPRDQRTAEGHLLLIENSLISSFPNTFVPYFNFFYGQGRTQSLARAGNAGGVLNNTGINFETDGLTGYPTLDATGVNTTGGAVGLNMLGDSFSNQVILEFAALAANGSAPFRNAPGDQFAFGARYQKPLNQTAIFRADAMYGFLRNAQDIHGSRVEMRWKF